MNKPSKRLLKIDTIKERLQPLSFELAQETYTGLGKKHLLKCKNNHIFYKKISHVLDGFVGCSDCNNSFKSERKFKETLEKILQIPFIKCRPKWLVNPETNRSLELDCYNADFKLAFEYDGQFHFEVRKGLNNNLAKTQQLDKLKDKLCKENGITLIRVPYFLKDADFYNKIIEGLKCMYGKNYWMVVRKAETNVDYPQEVKDLRAAARLKVL